MREQAVLARRAIPPRPDGRGFPRNWMKMSLTALCLVLCSSAVMAASPSTSFDAKAASALATKSGCMSCHKVDKKVVGPAFIDIAAKYSKDKLPVSQAVSFIKSGGKGNWGVIPMPPNKKLTDEEATILAEYVLMDSSKSPK